MQTDFLQQKDITSLVLPLQYVNLTNKIMIVNRKSQQVLKW